MAGERDSYVPEEKKSFWLIYAIVLVFYAIMITVYAVVVHIYTGKGAIDNVDADTDACPVKSSNIMQALFE